MEHSIELTWVPINIGPIRNIATNRRMLSAAAAAAPVDAGLDLSRVGMASLAGHLNEPADPTMDLITPTITHLQELTNRQAVAELATSEPRDWTRLATPAPVAPGSQSWSAPSHPAQREAVLVGAPVRTRPAVHPPGYGDAAIEGMSCQR